MSIGKKREKKLIGHRIDYTCSSRDKDTIHFFQKRGRREEGKKERVEREAMPF